jgi:hypothetical protein
MEKSAFKSPHPNLLPEGEGVFVLESSELSNVVNQKATAGENA